MEGERAEADFWSEPERASAKLARLSALQGPLDRLAALDDQLGDLKALDEMGQEAPDDGELLVEAAATVAECSRLADVLEMEVLLDGPHDKGDAIVEIHAGAGGTESQDWAQMLLRMYRRWCEDHKLRLEVIDALPGEEAGLRRVTVSVRGPNAFGLLRAEHGVHRLVRMSPFDASGRRHTSFASVDVLPDVPESEVEIRPEDLDIDTHRSSGAGGQHVNRTDSAVRIRHLPTGIVVTCQNERSQHGNRALAMQVLRARLAALAEAEREKQIEALRGPVGDIAFGNHMRSYVFAPYTMVKDLRTDVETGDVQSVMDGALDPFIQAYLVAKRRGTLQRV